jgi:heptosyltransferase-2
MPDAIHKTLIIRLSSVGDVVLASPLVRSLRGRYPDCRIDFLVKSAYADLVRHNPHLSRVLEFPDHGTIADLVRFRRAIASARYDLIIDIHDSIRSRFLSMGAPRVARIRKRKIARALLVRLKLDVYDRFGGSPGIVERYFETVRTFRITDDGKGTELFVPDLVHAYVDAMLAGEGVAAGTACIGICPSARHGNKVWPEDRFAAVAVRLAGPSRAAVLLFGSTAEHARCSSIAQAITESDGGIRAVNLAGRATLLESAAAMDRCSLVVTNDTGLMHIAASRGRQLVAIFGPTVRQFGFFPPPETSTVVERSDLECRPCTHIGLPQCPRKHFRCMLDIQVDAVAAAALGRMGRE